MAAAVFVADVDSAVGAHSEAVVLFVGAGSGAAVRFERVVIGAGASMALGAIAVDVIGVGAFMALGAIAVGVIGAGVSMALGAIAVGVIGVGVSMATGDIAAVAIFVDATAVGAATMALLRTRCTAITTIIRVPG